jgi:hypothetical protein
MNECTSVAGHFDDHVEALTRYMRYRPIAQCSMSRATPEATGCRHWAATHSVSPWRLPGQQQTIQRCNMYPLWWSLAIAMRWYYTVRIARWRRSRAFIKATKRRHWVSTRSDSVNRSSQCCYLAWCLRCDGDSVERWQLLHRGVTYQSDEKDLADGVEYLYWGAKLVS